jgi:rhodanese-related sulfurtransferase
MNAIAHFAAKLEFETDPSDVAAALAAGQDFVLIDSRSYAAWAQGRARGAIHLPTAEIASRASGIVAEGTPVVTYCWGPGCNGSTRAALAFAKLGYPVREMIGGYEYWVREGLPVDGAPAVVPDPLTTVVAIGCEC